MLPIKTAVFDLDGTLCDTLEDLADATNKALEDNGLPVRTLHEIQYAIGTGAKNLIKKTMPEETRDDEVLFSRVYERYLEVYRDNYLVKTKAYDGLVEQIALLKDAGVHIAVVTNKPDLRAREIVEACYPGMFEIIIGSGDKYPIKPDPTSTLQILKEFGTIPTMSVFIGDSDVDIRTALNAGMQCISVTWGFRTEEELKKAGGLRFARTPEDITRFILGN